MRNGNIIPGELPGLNEIVLILPMRNGNKLPTTIFAFSLFTVLILPMRNGNKYA